MVTGALARIARGSADIAMPICGVGYKNMKEPFEPKTIEDKQLWTGYLTNLINVKLEKLPRLNDKRSAVPETVFVHTNESQIENRERALWRYSH